MSKKHKLNYFLVAPYEVKGVMNADLSEALAFAEIHDEYGVDIETTRKFKGKYGKAEGLDPYLSKIVMFQFGTVDKQYIIDVRYYDITELLEVLVTKLIVGQNLRFEYAHLLYNYNLRLQKAYDTMLVEQILYNGLDRGKNVALAVLNKRYLNVTVDKTTRLEFATIGKKPFTAKQIQYGAEDILYPLLIKIKQLKRVEEKKLQQTLNIEHNFLLVNGDLQIKGLHFNKEIWEKAYNENVIERNEVEETLSNWVITNFRDNELFVDSQLDLFQPGVSCRIKWSSPKQVIEFFDFLGICPEAESKVTKKVRKTVQADELKLVLTRDDLSEDYRWLINTYLKLQKLYQATNTFGIKFFKYINPISGRLHSGYKQIMNTGRISSSNPNLQNIPSDPRYRKAFDAPTGYKIVNADYSGQEQIILANKALDKDLLEFYRSGNSDMHSFVASKIFPELKDLPLAEIKANHKEKRQIAKAAGFAINYGGTGFTIARNLGIPRAVGDAVYEAYFKAFPGLKNYFAKQKNAAVKNGYIEIDKHTKRKYFFPFFKDMQHAHRINDTNTYRKLRGQLERASLNYPIQGCAGSMTKLACVFIRSYLVKNNAFDRFQITNIVHDSHLFCRA